MTIHVADKLHGFLQNPKSRPDLQTPEAQALLAHLQNHYHNAKTDALMPWLTREWKKGRLRHDEGDAGLGRLWSSASGASLHPRELNHWADFLRSNHPVRRQLGDIMQHDIGSFADHADAWDQAMAAEAEQKALEGGKVVHTTPDGYTVRQLTTPQELEAEGNAMGHCVGSYGDVVQNGRSLIYSLRDPQGYPHVTTEIEPGPRRYTPHAPFDIERAFENHPTLGVAPENLKQQIRDHLNTPYPANQQTGEALADTSGAAPGLHGHTVDQLLNQLIARDREYTRQELPPRPHGGGIVQIQGKSNQTPDPKYQAQMKHWFQSFPDEERPHWSSSSGYPIDDAEELLDPEADNGYAGDYGLKSPPIDYKDIIPTVENRHSSGYEPDHVKAVYQAARERGEIPQLADALQHYREQTVYPELDDLRDQNFDFLDYPGEFEDDSERWDQAAQEWNYGTPKEAYDSAMRAYEENERELTSNHVPSQIDDEFSSYLTRHWNPATGQWDNEPYDPRGQYAQQAPTQPAPTPQVFT